MPPKTPKRTSQEAGPAAKKQKQDPALAKVVEAIEQGDLPDSSRKMIIAAAPAALKVPSDERHEVQSTMVRMIEETIMGVQSKLQADLDEERKNVSSFESRLVELASKKATAQDAAANSAETTKTKKQSLDESVEAVKAAKTALSRAQQTQRSEDASLVESQGIKSKLEDAIANHLSTIQSGESVELGKHYDALKPLFKLLDLEESLRGALESSCKKKLADRGSFDTMVLMQLVEQFNTKLAALDQTIQEAGPAAEARANAVREADDAFEGAKANHEKVSEELTAAKDAERDAAAELKAATSAVKNYGPEFDSATALRDEKETELENFTKFNVAEFERLRDRRSANTAPEGGA